MLQKVAIWKLNLVVTHMLSKNNSEKINQSSLVEHMLVKHVGALIMQKSKLYKTLLKHKWKKVASVIFERWNKSAYYYINKTDKCGNS